MTYGAREGSSEFLNVTLKAEVLASRLPRRWRKLAALPPCETNLVPKPDSTGSLTTNPV
jgi:hypothetical protein